MGTVKKSVFYALTIALVWIVAEVAVVVGHGVRYGRWYSPTRIQDQARVAASPAGFDAETAAASDGKALSRRWIEVIHPYFGVVLDPRRDPTGTVDEHGFISGSSPDVLTRSSPDSTRVAVFGGSLAAGLYRQARPVLLRQLASAGKPVETINFAKGGYKQPQQLLILAYMLSLGIELDVVVNVDGFNEVAIPPAENVPRGVYPFYPRMWQRRARDVIEPESVRQAGELAILEERRGARAARFLDHGLHRSAVLSLIWRYLDQRSERALHAARQNMVQQSAESTGSKLDRASWACLREEGMPEQAVKALKPLGHQRFTDLQALRQAVETRLGAARAAEHRSRIEQCAVEVSTSYARLGPRYEATEDELYDDLVANWERSSRQMKALCDVHGIRYLHFLQPNQYVAGSKVMSPEEERVALRDDQQYRPGAERGYPRLRDAGRRLLEHGVNFTDLTPVFRDVSEAVYADDCCHLNARGSEIVMGEIAATVVARLGADG